jgi:hypothetical protein
MVQIKKIVKAQPLSGFSQAVPSSGGSFDILAEAMKTGYDMLLPAAKDEMEKRGEALGREMARQQIGNPSRVSMSGMNNSSYNDSLSNTESGGNYWAVNSEGYGGKYQWGEARLADYNRATGQSITMAQFLDGTANGMKIQEDAQAWHNADIDKSLGDLVGQTVNGMVMTPNALRAAAHLGGIGGARKFVESGGAYDPADSNGTTLSKYARIHGGVGEGGRDYEPPTVIMDADGKLSSRMYSPLSHPVMQIGNAAAGVAYQSEIMLKAAADVMDMSNQFALDPQGFQGAANAYIEDMVANADDMFKGDIRASLTETVQKRFLGLMDEKQRDTRQRAANSNMALIDRYRDEFSQAITTGNQDEIDRSRARLDSVLKVRETLPGLAWTAEQSANEFIRAEDSGQKSIRAASDAQAKETKSQLSLIADAKGSATQFDAILQDPTVQARFPDEWREAAATKAFYTQLPSFRQATPAQQRAAADDLANDPVSQSFELDLARVADKEATDSAKAWDDSPIDQAYAVMAQKPPALPTPEQALADPSSIGSALAARVEYGVGLQQAEYTDTARFLTKAERETYGPLFGNDTPPEIKAVLASQIVAAAGPHAKQVFQELAAKDPVTFLAGSLMARGGDQEVALKAFRGQAKMNAGLVSSPDKDAKQAAITADIKTALAMLPNSEKLMGDTMEMAVALYAADAGQNGANAGDTATALTKALNEALGQSKDSKGRVTGGVQTVGGVPTIFPPGVSGEVVQRAIQSGLQGGAGFWQSLARGGAPNIAGDSPSVLAGANETGNSRATYRRGEVPMLGGEPLAAKHADKVFLRPISANQYALGLRYASGEVTDLRNADGSVYTVDLKKMMGGQ